MIYDVAIIGNGIVGSLLAYQLHKKKIKTCFIGEKKRLGSASVAAGAMLNVFGELDYWEKDTSYQSKKLKIGIDSFIEWNNFVSKFENQNNLKTADDTVIYLSKKATNLEKNCFNLIKKLNKEKNFKKVSKKSLNKIDILKKTKIYKNSKELLLIQGEGAINSNKLFNLLDKLILKSKYVSKNYSVCTSLKKINSTYHIKTNSNKIRSKKVIVCNGAFINDLMPNILPVYYGVGSALEVNDQFSKFNHIPKRTVIRTPNRGSTCGIHIVPRSPNNFYVGAGSYISKKPIYGHRIGTINYLTSCLEKEFTGKLPHTTTSLVQGFRPVSIDGKPLIGELINDSDIFIVSGTKRDGFTYAPIIVNHIMDNFLNNRKNKKLQNIFEDWKPDRKMLSFLDRTSACNSYIDNKISGLIEHGMINSSNHEKKVLIELRDEANKFHDFVIKKFKLDINFGIHPELLNVI